MISIEDYLALSDWQFSFSPRTGCHEGFYWLESDQLIVDDHGVDLLHIPLPPQFRILALTSDHAHAAQNAARWWNGNMRRARLQPAAR